MRQSLSTTWLQRIAKTSSVPFEDLHGWSGGLCWAASESPKLENRIKIWENNVLACYWSGCGLVQKKFGSLLEMKFQGTMTFRITSLLSKLMSWSKATAYDIGSSKLWFSAWRSELAIQCSWSSLLQRRLLCLRVSSFLYYLGLGRIWLMVLQVIWLGRLINLLGVKNYHFHVCLLGWVGSKGFARAWDWVWNVARWLEVFVKVGWMKAQR